MDLSVHFLEEKINKSYLPCISSADRFCRLAHVPLHRGEYWWTWIRFSPNVKFNITSNHALNQIEKNQNAYKLLTDFSCLHERSTNVCRTLNSVCVASEMYDASLILSIGEYLFSNVSAAHSPNRTSVELCSHDIKYISKITYNFGNTAANN